MEFPLSQGGKALCGLQLLIIIFDATIYGALAWFRDMSSSSFTDASYLRLSHAGWGIGYVFFLFGADLFFIMEFPLRSMVLHGGLMALLGFLAVVPAWIFSGLRRYFLCLQGIGAVGGMFLWPQWLFWPHVGWLLLASLGMYSLLFVCTAQWRLHKK